MGFKLWEDLLLGRIVPSISGTITALIIVLLVIKLFRVRNPGTRYLLYHLPLLKGLVILIRGVPAPLSGFEDRIRFGFQLIDPLSLFQMHDIAIRTLDVGFQQIDVQPQWDSALAQVVFFMALGAALGIIWISMGGAVAILPSPSLRTNSYTNGSASLICCS